VGRGSPADRVELGQRAGDAADLADTRLSLQGMLAVTFFQLRGLDLQAQLLRASIDAYTQTLQLTQVRLKGGVSTESDVAQAQAQLEADARAAHRPWRAARAV
jgi:outer membrane protein TolC